MPDNYDDIINLPHHVSDRHPHMSMADRAAQFSPFAALTGYGDLVNETARYTEERPVLTESEREELDAKFQWFLKNNPPDACLTITYFLPDEKKEGGSYQIRTGSVKKIDRFSQEIVLSDNSRIRIADVIELTGDGME